MNISDRIFKPESRTSYLGIAPINSPFDPVAVYVIDYGPDQPSFFEILLINRAFPLYVRSLPDGSFQYIVHGSVVVRKSNLEEIQKRIQNSKKEELNLDDLFSREMDPLFKDTQRVSSADHDRFQEALKKNGFWLLVVKSATDTFVFIEKDTGIVAKIHEASRQEFAIIEP